MLLPDSRELVRPIMDATLLTAQLLFTGALAGLCWTVQLAVYALFGGLIRSLGGDGFRVYHAAYTRAMGWIAAPLMLAEFALAIVWIAFAPDSNLARVGLGLVVVIWLLTFALIVPIHTCLQKAPAEADARRLTWLNGIRTALWTARAGLLAFVAINP
jgi:hypothetical protein